MPLVPRGRLFDLDQVFDNFLSPMQRLEQADTGFFAPRVYIHEKSDHYEIAAELPGVKREDIREIFTHEQAIGQCGGSGRSTALSTAAGLGGPRRASRV